MESSLKLNGTPTRNQPRGRLKLSSAAKILDVSTKQLRNWIEENIFTLIQDSDQGKFYLHADEVWFYVDFVGEPAERVAALRAYRQKRGRLPKTKRSK